ncbi:hypothetical protein BC826DRAFT_1105425 [Russula brevipes]|nr:hypothetical protein BC826DRAFT_1105425 [Russula brevipes]
MPTAHSLVPSVVSREHQIGPCPSPTHIVEHQAPRNPSPVEPDLISMDFLPHLAIARYPIATACHTGNFIATPLPFPEDAAANTAPPSLPPLSSSSPSSPDRHVPRACHGVERRQRSRPSSRGASDYHSFRQIGDGKGDRTGGAVPLDPGGLRSLPGSPAQGVSPYVAW